MKYQPASLTSEQLQKIQTLEEEISTSADHPVVLIAYEHEPPIDEDVLERRE